MDAFYTILSVLSLTAPSQEEDWDLEFPADYEGNSTTGNNGSSGTGMYCVVA
ncbi:hypothetical protein EV715DRAFT_275306 [Schizophyllum commune]|nr:hypothetical protein K525DRAFT_190365 [Schizophyllum commune Loenen D]